MYFFNFSLKKVFLICFLVLIPLFLITRDRKELENNILFQSVLYLSGKVQQGSRAFSTTLFQTVKAYTYLVKTNRENRTLMQENKALNARLSLMQEVRQENSRLKQLMRFSQTGKWKTLFAQVIGRDPLSEYQLITVNRGLEHGVKQNMPVISEKGFVGYVFRVKTSFAQVILLTDPHAAILSVIQRSRVQGIVEGAGPGKARLKYLKRKDDVQIGDIVVTARIHPFLISGFPIGKVSQINKETYGLTQQVIITPFMNPTELEEVLIVLQDTNRIQKKSNTQQKTP